MNYSKKCLEPDEQEGINKAPERGNWGHKQVDPWGRGKRDKQHLQIMELGRQYWEDDHKEELLDNSDKKD